MKTLIAAALISAASFATFALAADPPVAVPPKPGEAVLPSGAQNPDTAAMRAEAPAPAPAPLGEAAAIPDARSMASDAEVGQARRAYRAACSRYESAGFCDCVTAGVAQALMPQEVRVAARTIGERINAQGDAASTANTDAAPTGASSETRIEQVEGHYADACAQFRR